MTSWDRIETLFFAVLEMPDAERAGWLRELDGEEPAAATEVRAMLDAHLVAPPLRIEAGLDAHPAVADALLPAGTRVGPYRIDELLGTGGMAHVYRAHRVDGLYAQTVALKVLRPGYHAAEFIRLFEAERAILARLQHPDIAPILGGGTMEAGLPYLVMPLVEGLPITRHCIEHAMPIRARLRLFVRVCEAVQFAHARLIVHRDLKASNIMVTAAGDPVLLDFGIAKLLAPDDDDPLYTPTRTGLRMLTPEHAAPEQLAGAPVSTATDVYALGLLLFELLTNRPVPAPPGNGAVAEEAPLPGPLLRRAGQRALAGDLDRIVAMALRRDPAQRYPSAGQFAEDVERCLAGLPVRARPDSARYRARKFVRRHRGMVGAAAAIALLLAGSTIASVVQAHRVRAERDVAESQRLQAEAAIAVLTSIFESSNPRLVPGGDTLRITAFLERAEAEVEQLAGQPELQARMWHVLGNMHGARSRLDRAVELLRRSQALHTDLYGADDVRTARVAHDHALARAGFEGGAAAASLLRASAARLERLLGPTHIEAVGALQDLAVMTVDPDERARLLARVTTLRSTADSIGPMGAAALFNAQAGDHLARGRPASALALYGQAAAILDTIVEPDHPHRLTVAGNTAATLTSLGRFEEAARLARTVLDARLRLLGEESTEVATARESLAAALTHLGRYEEAESLFRQSLAVFERVLAPGHWRTRNALRNVGRIATLRGDHARSLALLDSALATSPDGLGQAHMRGQRAYTLLRLGRLAEARAEAVAASEAVRRLAPEGHRYRTDLAAWLGAIALSAGRALEAEDWYHAALANARILLADGHPQLAEAECGLAVSRALREADGGREASAPPDPACVAYAAWGLADDVLLRHAGLPPRTAVSP